MRPGEGSSPNVSVFTGLNHKNHQSRRRAITGIMALALRVQQRGWYDAALAKDELGLPLRTYRRYLAILRAAGMLLESRYSNNSPSLGWVRFICFDPLFFNREEKIA